MDIPTVQERGHAYFALAVLKLDPVAFATDSGTQTGKGQHQKHRTSGKMGRITHHTLIAM